MDDEKKQVLLSRDVGTLIMNVNRRAKAALHAKAMIEDYETYTISDASREAGENPHLMWRVMRFWEGTNPTMLSLARLAEVLDVDYVWLLAGDPAKVKWKERENVEV
tara:strand:+ start:158 stop:478 length:321 start_codon:yes stop_codon:yes gene_type:complete